ncbi:hypothetical protein MKX01_030053 [Papaver californicum]|nr:hypothetical protein MKX01_030053 [Papaver californicum]
MPKRKANKDSNGKDSMCRSPLDQLCDIAELIREEINDEDNPKPKHLEAMKNCPFWNFYRPFHEGRIDKKEMQKRHKGVEDILNTFNPKKNVFQLGGGKEFKSTAEQLAVIFGLQRIRAGAEDCTFNPLRQPNEGQKNLSPQETEFLKTYLKGRTQMKKRAILDSLYATAVDVTKSDDFVKLLVLYFCISIFFPNQTGWTLPNKFLKFIFAMDQVSWPDLIHSYLLQALKEVKKPCSSVRGCIVYILFWFAEVTHFLSKNEGELGKCKPRFARWDTWELTEKIGNEGLTSLKQDLTGSFIDPFDKDEQSLMTPIQIRQANSYRIGKKMVRGRESDEDWELSPGRDVARSLVDLQMAGDRESDEDWELSPDTDAARHLEDLAPVYPFKKRQASRDDSHPCEGKGICNAEPEPENLPLSEPMMPAIPIFPTQETEARENETDLLNTTVKDLHGNDVHIWSFLSCSEAHTTGVESLVEEPVDATMKTSSSKCQTPGSILLITSTSVDASPSFEHFRSRESGRI